MADLEAAYRFLLQHAQRRSAFRPAELAEASGWSPRRVQALLKSQLANIVCRQPHGVCTVDSNFQRLPQDEFIARITEKAPVLPSYARSAFGAVLRYDFLMPLTREGLLRSALDNLFYRDTLLAQIQLAGLERFTAQLPRGAREKDPAYAQRVAEATASYFAGYSITHVNGRYRAGTLLDQVQAARKHFVTDETTALVQFIVPLRQSQTRHGNNFDLSPVEAAPPPEALEAELALVRCLFFNIFAEALVHSVQGEEKIWLVETLNGQQKLYQWTLNKM